MYCSLIEASNELQHAFRRAKVYPLPSCEAIWNLTGFKFRGNYKDGAFRLFIRKFKRVFDFLLNVAGFTHRHS